MRREVRCGRKTQPVRGNWRELLLHIVRTRSESMITRQNLSSDTYNSNYRVEGFEWDAKSPPKNCRAVIGVYFQLEQKKLHLYWILLMFDMMCHWVSVVGLRILFVLLFESVFVVLGYTHCLF